MSTNILVTKYNIQPADAIVLSKKLFGMLDHYVIYVGIENREHKFVANYVEGVKIIPKDKIDPLLEVYVPSKIEKFPGPRHERPIAVKRALSRIGEKAYGLISNNCEHFKNYVHYGIENSTQVEKAAAGLTVGGIGLALLGIGRKNDAAVVWGIIILILGILVATFAKRETKQPQRNMNY